MQTEYLTEAERMRIEVEAKAAFAKAKMIPPNPYNRGTMRALIFTNAVQNVMLGRS